MTHHHIPKMADLPPLEMMFKTTSTRARVVKKSSTHHHSMRKPKSETESSQPSTETSSSSSSLESSISGSISFSSDAVTCDCGCGGEKANCKPKCESGTVCPGTETKCLKEAYRAVVTVRSFAPFIDVENGFSGSPQQQLLSGNGFFVTEDGAIVTAASNVLVPIIISPSAITKNVRVPGAARPADGLFTVKDIFVEVYVDSAFESLGEWDLERWGAEKCDSKHAEQRAPVAQIFQAKLVAIDGASDLALLRIDPCLEFNRQRKLPKKFPFLAWGDSRSYAAGREVSLVGLSLAGADPRDFSVGVVRNPTFHDGQGIITTEDLATSLPEVEAAFGAPILDECCRVVAVLHANLAERTFAVEQINSSAYATGVAQHFAQPIICEMLKLETIFAGAIIERNFSLIMDPYGDYFRRNKAFLGITVEAVNLFSLLSTLSGVFEPEDIIKLAFRKTRGWLVTSFSSGIIPDQPSPAAKVLKERDVIVAIGRANQIIVEPGRPLSTKLVVDFDGKIRAQSGRGAPLLKISLDQLIALGETFPLRLIYDSTSKLSPGTVIQLAVLTARSNYCEMETVEVRTENYPPYADIADLLGFV